MKRLLSLTALLLIAVASFAYDARIDGIYYDFSGNEATVTYKTYTYKTSLKEDDRYSSDYSGDIVIPEIIQYNNKTYVVTSIGTHAFTNCSIASVTLGDSIRTIHTKAFVYSTFAKDAYRYDGQNKSNDYYRIDVPKIYVNKNALALFKLYACSLMYYDGVKYYYGSITDYIFDRDTQEKIQPCNATASSISRLKINPINYTIISMNYYKVGSNHKTYEIDLPLTGLNPATKIIDDHEIDLSIRYVDNRGDTLSGHIYGGVYTSALKLSTQQPKVVSMGNVIVSATTNVDPEEKNVGFEWRRTDWTSDFASNSGNAVIYDNTMEGYIRNMNTDKLWKYRAYYLSDAGKYYYGDWVGLDASNTSYFEPTVHTYADISTSGKVALIRGYVLNGTDKIKVQGFKYWKTANKSNSLDIDMEGNMQTTAIPADAITETQAVMRNFTLTTAIPADAITQTVAIVGAGQQLMNATLENLDYGSTYQCVAFATTSENETFYGEVQSFTTEAAPTGIEGVKEAARSSKPVTVVAYYDINGKQLSAPQKGLNIIKMSDGTTKKIVR